MTPSREVRLKPEYAEMYPEIEAGVWMAAPVASARRLARVRLDGDAASLARVLDDEHFEFRGGRPREEASMRTRFGER
jgi:hypothetical protein